MVRYSTGDLNTGQKVRYSDHYFSTGDLNTGLFVRYSNGDLSTRNKAGPFAHNHERVFTLEGV